MIGVGEIFEAFRDGRLEDDDEVAVIHGEAEGGYRNLSTAMVESARDAAVAPKPPASSMVRRTHGSSRR